MKNSISRRSFLKKSSVAAVVAANASLLTGLVSAEEESGLCNEYQQWTTWSWDFPDVYGTRQEAEDFKDGLGDLSEYGVTYGPYLITTGVDCESYEPRTEGDGPEAIVLETAGGEFQVKIIGIIQEWWCE